MTDFTLSSSDFSENQLMGATFQADHPECASPQLSWSGAPAGTKGFAIAMHDPDAPTGGAGWWHWMVLVLPADVTALVRGAGAADGSGLPAAGRQMRHDGGGVGYMGCMPPEGERHRYIHTVYALDTDHIALPADASTSMAGFIINAHCIAQASVQHLFER